MRGSSIFRQGNPLRFVMSCQHLTLDVEEERNRPLCCCLVIFDLVFFAVVLTLLSLSKTKYFTIILIFSANFFEETVKETMEVFF